MWFMCGLYVYTSNFRNEIKALFSKKGYRSGYKFDNEENIRKAFVEAISYMGVGIKDEVE